MRLTRLAYFLALTSGAGSMAIEMTAARALSPFFGTSAFIWSTIISVVMLYIFLGNWLGGRLAEQGWGLRKLAAVHVMAAAGIATISQPLIRLLYAVTPDLALGSLSQLGVMLGSVMLLSLPVFLLAWTTPCLIEALTQEGFSAGLISGRIYGFSTMGGLLGTMLPTLFLIPLLGVRWTFWLTSLTLVLGALALVWGQKVNRTEMVALGVYGLSLLFYLIPAASLDSVIHHSESAHNTIWVEEGADHVDLLVNEREVIQSRLYKDPEKLPHDVWSLYTTGAFFSEGSQDKKVAFLGLAAGSAAHYYHRHFPGYQLTGVEIDGALVEAGKTYFQLDEIPMDIVVADARAYMRSTQSRFDVLIVDAFNFPYLPAHLSTVEFMEILRAKLNPGGVVLFNVGHYKSLRETVDVIGQTGLQVFAHAYEYAHPNGMNTLVYLTEHTLSKDWPLFRVEDNRVRSQALRVLMQLRPVAKKNTYISTDDRPLTEWFTHRIVLRAFGGG